MEFGREKYDLNNEQHCEELRNILLQHDSNAEDERIDTEDENSDTDTSVGLRRGNSESEQSGSCASEDEEEDNVTYFMAVQKKAKVVVGEWKWQRHPLSQRKRTPAQNIVMQLPRVIGDAKQGNGIYESWNLLITDTMIQEIVECTNKYIQSIQAQFSRSRDAKITDITEIKALIGLLYLAAVYHANRLSLDELWSEDGVQRFRKTMTLRRFRFIMAV
ncbi:Transposase IS4 [Popillia japonica]|uniref:Transposase IS4 n=1 Tax=Popillia japonica TaxID=7064 RepID=A0AAW1JH44_POPJA